MRTSLNEIQHIEGYLLNTGSTEEGLLVEAKMSLSNEFCQNVLSQQTAYKVIQSYGKSKLIDDIRTVEKQLFLSAKYKKFRSAIFNIFSK